LLSPISALTIAIGMPSVSAVIIVTIVLVPTPMSCVPHRMTTLPSGLISQCALVPCRRRPSDWPRTPCHA
jgi:hypothetical protein